MSNHDNNFFRSGPNDPIADHYEEIYQLIQDVNEKMERLLMPAEEFVMTSKAMC